MAHGRFIAYQPTSLRVVDGHSTQADPASLRADLKALRSRFDGLITYTAVNGTEAIPGIAASLGYKAIIVGVWNPFDETEVAAALEQARRYPQLVVGLTLGNEVMFSGRHGQPELAAVIADVRRQAPQLPLSTTEPFHLFDVDSAKPLLAQLDFLLPIVHPVFQPWFRDAAAAKAAAFVVNAVGNLEARFCGPVLVKEVGEPTAPAELGYSPERQAALFEELRKQFPPQRLRAFAYFSAFDAPWRAYDALAVPPGQKGTGAGTGTGSGEGSGGGTAGAAGAHAAEAHWGLYDDQRRPKPAAEGLPLLRAK